MKGRGGTLRWRMGSVMRSCRLHGIESAACKKKKERAESIANMFCRYHVSWN